MLSLFGPRALGERSLGRPFQEEPGRRRGGLTEGGNDETGRAVGLRINKGQAGLTVEMGSFHRVGEGRGYSKSGEGGVVLG